MSKKVSALNLTNEIYAMFVTYGQEVNEVLDGALESVAEEATAELQAVTKFNPDRNPSGEYSKDWTYKIEPVKRFSRKVIVYNDEHYGLAHLLENGHVVKNGGRKTGKAPAYEHIKPVNDKAQENFIEEVIERIADLNS